MEFRHKQRVFDYRTLRLLLGIIALTLPLLVTLVAQKQLPSVSASYHTEARDYFVGLLFVVAAFMWAYNGHSPRESLASKAASVAAICVALFPTARECGVANLASSIHGIAAVFLFSILAYFCFGPFRKNTKGKGGKKGARAKLYFLCGSVMVGSMVAGAIGKLFLPCETVMSLSLMYWVEAVALGAFGVAWIIAGKIIPVIVDENEALKLFSH